MSFPVTCEDFTIILSCLPGEKECIESVERARKMKEALRDVIRTIPRFVHIVDSLKPEIRGNTLGFLIDSAIGTDGKFMYQVTPGDVESLKKILDYVRSGHPYAADRLGKAIDFYCSSNEPKLLQVDRKESSKLELTVDARPPQAKKDSSKPEFVKADAKLTQRDTDQKTIGFFRKHPDQIRHGVSGEFAPIYYTSTSMIDIFNALAHHDRINTGGPDDPIIAVGPMSRGLCELMQVPMNFPREGYVPVLDLEAKLLLLVPITKLRLQHDVLMSGQLEGL